MNKTITIATTLEITPLESASMNNLELRNLEILEIKRTMVTSYIYIMCTVIILFGFMFCTWIFDPFMMFYTFSMGSILYFGWTIFKNRYPLDKIVRTYLVIGPFFTFFILMHFWHSSIVSYIWLLPLPFAAFIFFNKKEVIYFSMYTIFLIIIFFIIINKLSINFPNYSMENLRYVDALTISANIVVVATFSYYKGKIRDLKILNEIEERVKISLPVSLDDSEVLKLNLIFERAEAAIEDNQLYKISDLNISMLSVILKVSNNYVSKSIRLRGFTNFNAYINHHRIAHAKKTLVTSDFNKFTLAHIYTEAGFTSQSTFNRAFKQIEGITPSEFIQIKTKQEIEESSKNQILLSNQENYI